MEKNLSDLKPIESFIAVTDGVCPTNGRPLWKTNNRVLFRPSVEDVRVWWVVVESWCQWVSSDPDAVVDMHRLVLASKPQSKQSLRFVAAHDGSVRTDPLYTESRVSWRAGDDILFRKAESVDVAARDGSWLMFITDQDQWCVAPENVDHVYRFLEKQALRSASKPSQFVADGSVAGRAACSKPNVQEIDRIGEPRPRDFIATHMGGISSSYICWDSGNEVVFYKNKQSWMVQIRSWTASEGALRASNPFVVAAHQLRPDEIEQVWRALNAAPTLKASGTPLPPKQTSVKELAAYAARDAEMTVKLARENLAALSFIAPTAGSISTSAEGGLGWDEGERIIFRAFDRLSAYYEDGAWELILGGNTCKISRDRVLDVHRGLVKLRDSAKEPQKEPEPVPDPYRMHRLNDVNNSLTHAQTAVAKTLSALQALRMAVTGESRRNGKRKSIVKRPTSLATAAKSMRHMLRELQQLTEQMEKRSGK